ncbi:MAG: AraC family transcriptional regulator [Bacteroidota bacterium]
MKPILEKVPDYVNASIAVKRELIPHMVYPWHYHPEYEIIYVKKSYGTRLMGNHIGNFYDGDMVLVGSNLPHVWKNDNDFYKNDDSKTVDVYVIHFLIEKIATTLFSLPEAMNIKKLLVKSAQGLQITGTTHSVVAEKIEALYMSKGFERIVQLLEILNILSESKDLIPLSNKGFHHVTNEVDQERIRAVYDYVMLNYPHKISIEKVSDMLHLTKSSFCRYFKSRTTKTFSRFLNEVRVGKACRLLISKNYTVSEISKMVGYNNISHFNRQFKEITGKTPKLFSSEYDT